MLGSNFKSVFILDTFDNHRVTVETIVIQSIHIAGVWEQVSHPLYYLIERVAHLVLPAAGEVTVMQTGLSSLFLSFSLLMRTVSLISI